jgi:hypothetical protein
MLLIGAEEWSSLLRSGGTAEDVSSKSFSSFSEDIRDDFLGLGGFDGSLFDASIIVWGRWGHSSLDYGSR